MSRSFFCCATCRSDDANFVCCARLHIIVRKFFVASSFLLENAEESMLLLTKTYFPQKASYVTCALNYATCAFALYNLAHITPTNYHFVVNVRSFSA